MSVSKIFRIFYGFILKYRFGFLWFLIMVIISSILSSLTPYFFKVFVDAIPAFDLTLLTKILIAYMLVKIGSLVTSVLSYYLGDRVLIPAASDARISIFDHVQALDFGFHSRKSTGSLISAFKRGDSAFFTIFHVVNIAFVRTFVAFLVMVYFFIQLNSLITIIASIAAVAMLVATRYLISANVRAREAFNREDDEISGIITDNLINFETVKFFAKENWELERLKVKYKDWIKSLWGYANTFRYIDVGIGAIDNVSILILTALSIILTVRHKLTVGDFVLISAVLSNFYARIWDLVWNVRDLAKNYADIEKYFELLGFEIEVPDPKVDTSLSKVRGKIEFNNVSHSYKGGTRNAIKNFSLKVKPGESVAFVGRSGSGKTTLTKLLIRFFDPTHGNITIDGIDIRKFKKTTLRNFFGVVPQEPVLFNNTIAFNIGYGSRSVVTIEDIKKAARLANIYDFIMKLKNKFETNVGERGIKLSGGQKQRLAIARMILSNPDIIIFDEATSHLDSESEKLIQEAFWDVAKGKTTIIIAHRLSTVMRADRIVVMENGEIKEMGTHKELLKDSNSLYSHFWNLQIKLD